MYSLQLHILFSTPEPTPPGPPTAGAAAGESTVPPSQPLKSSLKKSASVGGALSNEFSTFSKSGIQRVNPFQSSKESILLGGVSGSSKRATKDAWHEREATRRREERDEAYFNESYQNRSLASGTGVEGEERTDADYAFLRRRSELPLHKLTRGQLDTARELSFEREGAPANSSPFRSGYAPRASSAESPRNPFRNSAGEGIRAVHSAARASDEHLMSTIDYLEKFLARARGDARRTAGPSPWKSHMDRMGGPEAIGRAAAYEEDDVLHGRRDRPASAPAHGRGYLAPTIESDPWGTPPPARHKWTDPDEEFELAKVEAELLSLKRQAEGLSPVMNSRERERQVNLALSNVRDRADIERSIALLKDYTQGRPLPEDDAENMARSIAAKLFAEEPEHTPKSRIPTHHPHRTGKNHHTAQCIYCKRELDWQSWNTKVINLLDKSFPNRSPTWKTPSKRLYDDSHNVEAGASRLTPLAKKLLETTRSVTTHTMHAHTT